MIPVDVELWARDAGRALARGDLVIVIDALRSGTCIVNALANGAEALIPTLSLREAHRLRSQHPEFPLAGERGGKKPAGFDLGNSPLEFTRANVEGKTVVITTTSGTAALVKSQKAATVLIGAFLNAGAVAEKAEEIATDEKVGISFVLAGDKGKFSLEDSLCAGAIVEGFKPSSAVLSDKARISLLAFKTAKSNLVKNVMETTHARHLVDLGFKEDVVFSCRLNTSRLVPIYKNTRIVLAN